MKIYALKPFEADIGYASPVEATTLSNTAAAAGGAGAGGGWRDETDGVIIAPHGTSRNSDTRL